jgi:hypothetical protein
VRSRAEPSESPAREWNLTGTRVARLLAVLPVSCGTFDEERIMPGMKQRATCHTVVAAFAVAALGSALFTPLARAAVTVSLDPLGGGGLNPNNVLQATGFNWAPGNSVLIGGGNLTSASVGTNVTLLYDALIAGIPTVGTNTVP